MRILLFGRGGQVGWELQRALAPLGELVACGRAEADFERPEAVADLVRATAPQAIVNAAAYTAVDRAESEPQRARRINTEAVARLAEAAARLGAWLVHYSTDYVFDGTKPGPYVEEDTTHPLNVYGLTKRDGEAAIRASGCHHVIFRTSWVYAARGHNFLKTILRLAGEREELRVVADQRGAPTGAELIADVTAHCLYRLAHDPAFAKEAGGIYHLAAAGETTWHEYAKWLVAEARRLGAKLRLDPERIVPIATSDYPTPARRPANSLLDTAKLRKRFGLCLPHWRQGVARVLQELTEVFA